MRGLLERRLSAAARAPLCALVASAFCACTPDFQSQSQVVDLRVLAVQAEPPEAQFDPDGGTVDPVKLTVLAVDGARPDAGATLTARLCAATDSGVCDEGPSIAADTLSRDGGDLFSTTLVLPQAVVAEAADASDLRGFDGVRVQYSFSIDDGDDAGPQTGEKVIVYSQKTDAGLLGHPNKNPVLAGAQFTEPDGGTQQIQDGQPLAAPAEVALGLTPILPRDQVETYQTFDLRGNLITLPEFPAYSFYTTGNAEFDSDTASEPVDGGAAPPQGLTRFTAHAGQGTLWIVVRDGRGGESWLTIPWSSTR
ncbi:MAG TPA: hypothetical protein VGH20_13765 [Myxococcales bacterium]|jgi:hypothetical protein